MWATALQPDGELIAVGSFDSFDGEPRKRIARIARINSDGSVDTTFHPWRGANGSIATIALQPDVRLVIGGMFTAYDLVSRNVIARVESDGSLDTSFARELGSRGTLEVKSPNPSRR